MILLPIIFFLSFLKTNSLPTNISYFHRIDHPLVLAHRGASGYLPESTLESFSVAMYGNTDFVEMDVVLTKDLQLLVMHDPYLSRVTNIVDFPEYATRKSTRFVANKTVNDYFTDDFTLEEIKKLSIKQGLVETRPKIFDFMFKAPSLDEFLQFMIKENQKIIAKATNNKIIGVFLEAKNGDMYKKIYGEEFEIGELLLKKLGEYGLADANNASLYCPVVLQSFPIETTKYFELSGNNLPRIQLLNDGIYNYDLQEVVKYAHGVGVSFPMILQKTDNKKHIKKNEFVKECHKIELEVFAYTFQDDVSFFGRSPEEGYKLAQHYLELDGVFTEFFDVAITVYKAEQLDKEKRRENN